MIDTQIQVRQLRMLFYLYSPNDCGFITRCFCGECDHSTLALHCTTAYQIKTHAWHSCGDVCRFSCWINSGNYRGILWLVAVEWRRIELECNMRKSIMSTMYYLVVLSCGFLLGFLFSYFCSKSETSGTEEGLKNPFDAIKNLGKQINKIPGSIADVGKEVKKLPKAVNSLGDEIPKKILTPIEKQFMSFTKDLAFFKAAWLIVVQIFKALFSYLECGFQMVKNLPQCWYYYALDLVAQLIYLPIRFAVWMFSLTEIEKAIWDYIEEADGMVHEATGYHIIHYSDDITKRCYSCKVTPMPRI